MHVVACWKPAQSRDTCIDFYSTAVMFMSPSPGFMHHIHCPAIALDTGITRRKGVKRPTGLDASRVFYAMSNITVAHCPSDCYSVSRQDSEPICTEIPRYPPSWLAYRACTRKVISTSPLSSPYAVRRQQHSRNSSN